jgi:hypothetical protein
VLLNLRGAILRNGRRVVDPRLVAGDRFQLASDVMLEVVEVCVPDTMWMLVTDGERVPIDPSVSVLTDPTRVQAGRAGGARHTLWTDGERCFDGETPVADGHVVQVGPWSAQVTQVSLDAHPGQETELRRSGPLRVQARYLSVAIHDSEGLAVTLTGISARILHELIEFDGPTSWEVIARELWPGAIREVPLRRRWDSALVRLRRHLAAAGVRDDLVGSDGHGHVELLRFPGDTFTIDG